MNRQIRVNGRLYEAVSNTLPLHESSWKVSSSDDSFVEMESKDLGFHVRVSSRERSGRFPYEVTVYATAYDSCELVYQTMTAKDGIDLKSLANDVTKDVQIAFGDANFGRLVTYIDRRQAQSWLKQSRQLLQNRVKKTMQKHLR